MKNLTLIIPTRNEKESLPIFLKELEKYNCSKHIVLDNKDYVTLKAIKNIKKIKIIRQKKSGYGNALIAGIKSAKTKYCCIINADGSMDPKYLQKKLKIANNYDFIFSSRYSGKLAGSEDDDFITLIGNYFFSLIGKIFFSLKINDILYTYILGKTKSFKNLNLKYYDFRICVEIPIKAKRKNYLIRDFASYERKRKGGKKKVNAIIDGFLILITMIKLFFQK